MEHSLTRFFRALARSTRRPQITIQLFQRPGRNQLSIPKPRKHMPINLSPQTPYFMMYTLVSLSYTSQI